MGLTTFQILQHCGSDRLVSSRLDSKLHVASLPTGVREMIAAKVLATRTQ